MPSGRTRWLFEYVFPVHGLTAIRRIEAVGRGARGIFKTQKVGTGKLLLFGPEIAFRAQPHVHLQVYVPMGSTTEAANRSALGD